MSETARRTAQPVGLGTVAKRGAVAVVLSIVANAIVLFLARDVLTVAPGFDPIDWTPVVLFTTIGAIAATAVYGATTRLSAIPDRRFTQIAAVALLLSFVPDVGLLLVDPAATLPGVLVLMFMHVVVAVVCVWALARSNV